MSDKIANLYFDWICDSVCRDRSSQRISYDKLLRCLHDIEFRYSMPDDANRAEDGIGLRYRFAYDTGCACADSHLSGPCSVLEMLVALSIRCENFMEDPQIGNRTQQWFWGMIVNLGLGGMYNDRFDRQEANAIIRMFLDRDYEPNGRGGLFRIRSCDVDLRRVEIWKQLCWYLDSIT